MLHLGNHENARRYAAPDGIIDHARFVEHAAVFLRNQSAVQLVNGCLGAMHARNVGHKPGGVGDGRHFNHRFGTIDEFHQQADIHIPAVGFFLIIVWDRVEIERIVLAFASGHDLVPHGGNELDQFHAG